MGRTRTGYGLLRNRARICWAEDAVRAAHSLLPTRATEARDDAQRALPQSAPLDPRGPHQGRRRTRPGDRLDVQDEQHRQGTPGRRHSARRPRGQRHPARLPCDGAHGRPRRGLLLRGHERHKHPDRGPGHNRPPRLLPPPPEEPRQGRTSPTHRRGAKVTTKEAKTMPEIRNETAHTKLRITREEAQHVANMLRYAVSLNTTAGLVSPTQRRLATTTYKAVELA